MKQTSIHSRNTAAWRVLLRSMGIGLICGLVLFFAIFQIVTSLRTPRVHRISSDTAQTFSSAADPALPVAVVIVTRGGNAAAARQLVSDTTNPWEGLGAISGAGIAISPDGPMITSRRLVQGATAIMVCYNHGESCYKAHLLGGDPRTDMALLGVEAIDLPYIRPNTLSREVIDRILSVPSELDSISPLKRRSRTELTNNSL